MNMENKQGMKKIFLHSDLHFFEGSGYQPFNDNKIQPPIIMLQSLSRFIIWPHIKFFIHYRSIMYFNELSSLLEILKSAPKRICDQ